MTDGLQDGDLLKKITSIEQGNVLIEGRVYTRLSSESMPNFLNRVRTEEYQVNARKDREAAAKASEAANSQGSTQSPDASYKGNSVRSSAGGVQSLKEVLHEQVERLTEKCGKLHDEFEAVIERSDQLENELIDVRQELLLAEKFMEMYNNNNTPEVPHTVGEDIPGQDS